MAKMTQKPPGRHQPGGTYLSVTRPDIGLAG